MVYDFLNPHVRLVILSTLDKPQSLYGIGKSWFSNIGRFYNSYIIKETNKAVKLKYLTKIKNEYKSDTHRIVNEAIDGIDFEFDDKKIISYVADYKEKLRLFYDELSDFSHPTYLNEELVKILVNKNPEVASNLEIKTVIQLPFILRYMERQSKVSLRLVLSLLNLNEYYKKLSEFENKNSHLLKDPEKNKLFSECCAYIIGSYYPKFFQGDENLLKKSFDLIVKR